MPDLQCVKEYNFHEYRSLQLKLQTSPTLKIDIHVTVFPWIRVSISFIHILYDLLHKVLINVKNLEGSEMLPVALQLPNCLTPHAFPMTS